MDYPCYVKIKSESENEDVELPTEEDGTLLLSSVASQFPGALGLRSKSESGSWRGVSLNGDNVLVTPPGGWGSVEYHVVMPKRAEKRKVEEDSEDEDDSPLGKLSRMSEREILSDLIMRNLPFNSTEDELKTFFSKFGEVEAVEIKLDGEKKSRGFGFISFKTVDAVKACLSEEYHAIQGRNVEVTFPKRKGDKDEDNNIPTTKLFVGRLPPGTTKEELQEMFSEFGELTDTYIPQPFKGYGFVTYKKKKVVKKVLKADHTLKGRSLNVSFPQTEKFNPKDPYNVSGYQGSGYSAGYQGSGYQGAGYQGSGYQSSGYQGSGYQGSGYQGSGYQGSGYKGSGYQGSGSQGPRNQGPGNQFPRNQGPRNQGPKNQGSGNQVSGNQGPDNQKMADMFSFMYNAFKNPEMFRNGMPTQGAGNFGSGDQSNTNYRGGR